MMRLYQPDALTLQEWRAKGKRLYGTSKAGVAMRRHALATGKAVALLSDDSACVVTRDPSKRQGFTKATLRVGSFAWTR